VGEKEIKKGSVVSVPQVVELKYPRDERLHRIKPMEGHPLGIVCARGVHAEEVIYSPDRLPFPMKRIGNRGEGKLERISWEEAFELSARLIKKIVEKYGPEAMAIIQGGEGLKSRFGILYRRGHDHICLNFLFPLGSPNTSVAVPFVTIPTGYWLLCLHLESPMNISFQISRRAIRLLSGDPTLLQILSH